MFKKSTVAISILSAIVIYDEVVNVINVKRNKKLQTALERETALIMYLSSKLDKADVPLDDFDKTIMNSI